MALIRHTSTGVERDVPDEAVAYFPDYEPVDAEPAGDEDFPHFLDQHLGDADPDADQT